MRGITPAAPSVRARSSLHDRGDPDAGANEQTRERREAAPYEQPATIHAWLRRLIGHDGFQWKSMNHRGAFPAVDRRGVRQL